MRARKNIDADQGALAQAREAALAAEERLRAAIDALPEGVVFLDPEGRYILWNERYAEIYRKSADLFFPGARFADTLEMGVARGDYPEAAGREQQWLDERIELLNNPGNRHEQWLSDGRCIMIEERKTSDGGTIGLRVDITEMKQREESFRLLFESNPTPLLVYDPPSETIRAANHAAVRHFGHEPHHFHDLPAEQLFAVEEWDDARRMLASSEFDPSRYWRQRTRTGDDLESVLFAKQAVIDGRLSTILSIFDVTERRRAEARMAHMARHDELTGLANRAYCRERLNELTSGPKSPWLAVMMIDLDLFKSVNDSYGHQVGDDLLAQAAQRLVGTAPPGALTARLGGDEFALLLTEEMSQEQLRTIAVGLIDCLSDAFFVAEHRLHIGATIGIAVAPADAADPETLLRYADLALYAAKSERRGTCCFFDPEFDVAAQDRRSLENDFRMAVRQGQLKVHYQPLINLKTGEIDGYEALLRWQHPTRGEVPPTQFIPLAEEIGLIDIVGQFVLQSACEQCATWDAPVRIAVNVSPVQFRSSNLLALAAYALASSGLEPSRLELEITEAVLMDKSPHVTSTMKALRSLGVGISMDDFGTGYSSLSYLMSFPFTKIKIDRSFITSLDVRPNSQAIVKAIINLAESLGMKVTAEGIEDAEVLEYLRGEGCHQGQGYLFGEARPAVVSPSANVIRAA